MKYSACLGSHLSLLILSVMSSVSILGWLLKYSYYGIDFTDESFYLVWLSNPFIYDWSLSQFGFIYHPLYLLVEGNIGALRQTNILITFGLAWVLVNTFLKVVIPQNAHNPIERIALSAGFATSSLILFDSWLPTPSYNSLTLQALLVAATGMLLAEAPASRSSVLGWALIGAGGWLAFMAKPSTALALAVCVVTYLLLAKKINYRQFLISIVVTAFLLILSALMIDGSLVKFTERLKTGVEYVSFLESGYSLSQIVKVDNFHLNDHDKIFLTLLTLYSIGTASCACSSRTSLKLAGFAFSFLLFAVIVFFTLDLGQKNLGLSKFQGLLIWTIPFSAAVLGLASYRLKAFVAIPISHWLFGLTMVTLPHVYAFGTSNNYWQVGSSAGVFWLLAGLILVAPMARCREKREILPLLALVTQVIVVLLLHTGFESPYRQKQALRLNDHLIEFGKSGSTLKVSEGYANYLREAVAAAKGAGFEEGTPVIDLSGQSPGILYAIQARSIGKAWLIGGYPGSIRQATAALKHVSCDNMATAWLLVEPDGSRSIPDKLLTSFGASLALDYTEVATWRTAAGAGGYEEQRLQILLKPTRTEELAVQACIDKLGK